MEKEYYNTFNLGCQILHYISKESNAGLGTENPPITSFGMATKNRSIKVIQKKGSRAIMMLKKKIWKISPF